MDSEAYVARGIAYLERSGFLIGFFGASYVEARRSFEKAIELDSQNAEAHVWHGIINELRDENSQAVADFRRAIEIAPDEFETHVENYRAWVSSLPRAHPFNVAVAIDATDANAYLGRALVYVHTGIITDGSGFLDYQARLALVLADFSKALELNPNYTQAYRARAEVYTERSYYEEAIADLERVIQLDPTD
jgi:Tfp pilus assembly protein PilF